MRPESMRPGLVQSLASSLLPTRPMPLFFSALQSTSLGVRLREDRAQDPLLMIGESDQLATTEVELLLANVTMSERYVSMRAASSTTRVSRGHLARERHHRGVPD
jgi:hypothetical protein